MGITKTDIDLLEIAFKANPKMKSVVELGSQNLYLETYSKPPFASEWYKARGLDYACIDMAGDNEAHKLDLSEPLKEIIPRGVNSLDDWGGGFDLVTDFGTSEHVVQMHKHITHAFHEGHINSIYPDGEPKNIELGYYNCWLNKFNLLAKGGLVVNVNPKTGHWPEHGYTYLDKEFYTLLANVSDLKIIELNETAAMGNDISGVNICCILTKTGDNFPTFDTFKKIPTYRK